MIGILGYSLFCAYEIRASTDPQHVVKNNYDNGDRFIGTLNSDEEIIADWMTTEKIGQYGNILAFLSKNGYIILQSGLSTIGAKQLCAELKRHSITASVMSGAYIVASALKPGAQSPQSKLEFKEFENNIQQLAAGKNIERLKSENIIDCFLKYAEMVLMVIERQSKHLGFDKNDPKLVGNTKSYENLKQLLNTMKQLSDTGILKALSALVQALNNPTTYQPIIEAYTNEIKKCELSLKKKKKIMKIEDIISDEEIENGLTWLKKSLHTEIQLAYLDAYTHSQIATNSSIFSAYEPCISCEQSAPLPNWIDAKHRFISFHLNGSEHSKEITGLMQYQILMPSSSKAYITIRGNEY